MELWQNPFAVLGATSRDSRRRILDLAEEKSLRSDEGAVREAAAVLTNPRKRLAAEIGWLPGLAPTRIDELLSLLSSNPLVVRDQEKLPDLAKANLLADGLGHVVSELDTHGVARWILDLSVVVDDTQVEHTASLINEDRLLAGLPAIKDLGDVDAEIQLRRQYFRRSITDALDQLATADLLDAVSIAVEQATENGQLAAPLLVDEVVDSFEVEAQEFLQNEADNVSALIDGIFAVARQGDDQERINSLVSKLEEVIRNWDRVAQPIQLSARARGLDHELSDRISNEVRRLAVALYNEHGLLDISQRLTALQLEVFAELDKVVERSEEDACTLAELAKQRSTFTEEIQSRAESWRREITYEAEIGVVFKAKLRISPDGVEWQGRRIALEDINAIRWGGTRHSVNGVPTGTTYSIFVGGRSGAMRVELRKGKVYSDFIDHLWKAVGIRILIEMLEGLRAGKTYRFGSAVLSDEGVVLVRRHLFRGDETVACKWSELVIWNASGRFYIAKKDDKRVFAELPYEVINNVHVLEAAMRAFWSDGSLRLSDLLDQET